MKLRSKVLLHVFFWLIVEATWYQHLYFHGKLRAGELEWIISTHIVHLATFYIFYFLFAVGGRTGTIRLAVMGAIIYLLVCPARYYGLNSLYEYLGNPQFFQHMSTWWSTFFETFMFGVHASLIALIESRIRFEKLKKELSEQNAQSEMALLRSQISPHFLYNTLNNIYSLAYPQADKAARAIMKLSDIMRYSLTEANAGLVALQQEIDYLNSYIALEKMRYRDPSFIEFAVEGEVIRQRIAPMLFIPFVENAFKHGTNSFVRLYLKVGGNEVCFHVENDYNKDQQECARSGIGLKNVKRRLELIYPGSHELTIVNDQKMRRFSVDLKIQVP